MSKEEQNQESWASRRPVAKGGAGNGPAGPGKTVPETGVAEGKKKGKADVVGSIPLHGPVLPQKAPQPESKRSMNRPVAARPVTRGRKKQSVPKPWYVIAMLWGALVVGCYGVASFFLVPTLVKGPLVERLSLLTGHNVSIGTVLFSPFTLNLKLNDMSVWRAGEGERRDMLLSVSNIRCDLSLLSLLQDRTPVHSLTVDRMVLNLIRYQGLDFNVSRLHRQMLSEHPEVEKALNVSWLMPGRMDILDSQIVFDDKPASKQHKIEQINFHLPPVSKSGDESRVPKLTAMINASPVQISAKRVVTEKGSRETHLSLYSKQINLPDYLGYLPQFSEKFYFAAGSGEIHFDLIFAVDDSGHKDFLLKGSASFSGVELNRADKTPFAKLPSILMALRTSPLSRQVEIEDIVLKEPALYLDAQSRAGKKDHEKIDLSMESISGSLNSLPIGLKIERMLLDKGFVVFGSRTGKKIENTNWHDIHLSLTGFESAGFAETAGTGGGRKASFQLSGVSRSGKQSMSGSLQGTLDSHLRAEGRMTVRDVDLVKYQSLFLNSKNYSVSGGQVNLDAMFVYQPKSSTAKGGADVHGLRLHDGNFGLRDFTLLAGRNPLLSGRGFTCSNVEVGYSEMKFSCSRLDVDEAEIMTDFWSHGFLAKKTGKRPSWKMEFDDLDIQRSVVHLDVPLPDRDNEHEKVELTNVSISARGLRKALHQKPNVLGQAQIAGKGEVRINGVYSQSAGMGSLQTSFKDIDLVFLKPFYKSWLAPDVLQGSIHGSGTLDMGGKRFVGKVWIDDFAAGWEKEAVVRWRKASSDTVAFTFEPLHVGMDQVLVEQPEVHFPNRRRIGSIQYFNPLQKSEDSSVSISKVDINQVLVKDGRCSFGEPLIAEGFVPSVGGVEGSLANIHSNKPVTFDLKGMMNGTIGFEVQGVTDLFRVNRYDLKVDDFAIAALGKKTVESLGPLPEEGVVSLLQSMTLNGEIREYSDTVVLKKIRPLRESAYGHVFSLMIDDKNELPFVFKRSESDETSSPLFDELLVRFKHDAVKASLSQGLVLKSFFPELDLPETIEFEPGAAASETVTRLDDYAILLGKRPWLKLVLSGSYDEDLDGKALQAVLQAHAQSERDLENQRRKDELKRQEQAKKEKLEAIAKDSKQIVEENISREELNKELEPLPPVEPVVLPDGALETLGRQRLEKVREYFDMNLGLDAARIEWSMDVMGQGPKVILELLPVYR